jgi:hypothetical protein
MPNLPLQGDASSRPTTSVHLDGVVSNRGRMGLGPDYGFDAMNQYNPIPAVGGHPSRLPLNWDGTGGMEYVANASGNLPVYSQTRAVPERMGSYQVIDDAAYGPAGGYQQSPYAGISGGGFQGPTYRGGSAPQLNSLAPGRSPVSYSRQPQTAPRNMGYRVPDASVMRQQLQSGQSPYFTNDLHMPAAPIPAHIQRSGGMREAAYNTGIPVERQQFSYPAGPQPGDQRRYSSGGPSNPGLAVRAPSNTLQYMSGQSLSSMPSIPAASLGSVAQVPYFIPNLHSNSAGPRPMSQISQMSHINQMGQDDGNVGYVALQSQYPPNVDEQYLRSLNPPRR